MKSWSAARRLANKISVRSTEPADWLENTGCGIKWIFYWVGPHMYFSLEVTKGLTKFNNNLSKTCCRCTNIFRAPFRCVWRYVMLTSRMKSLIFRGQMNPYFVVIGLISRQNDSLNMFAHCSDVSWAHNQNSVYPCSTLDLAMIHLFVQT